MSRKKKWIERAKSLLILLLTASAVFLAWKTGLFQRLLPVSVPASRSVTVAPDAGASAPA